MKLTECVVVAALMSACATPQMSTPFDKAEHDKFMQKGTAIITGQAFMSGGTVTCADRTVYLMPNTAYVREYIRQLQDKSRDVSAGPPEGLFRTTTCDAQGNFKFIDLPVESFWVLTNVLWAVGLEQKGGLLADTVMTRENQTVNIHLTDVNLIRRPAE